MADSTTLTARTPLAVYVSFWRGEIERMRWAGRLFRHDRQRRREVALCRKAAGRALRRHGAPYRTTEASDERE